IDPARPPLPTASSLWFHSRGIQISNFTSGATVAATRQKPGTWAGCSSPGTLKSPSGTEAAWEIVTLGSASLVRLSQDCWAYAGRAAKRAPANANRKRSGMGYILSCQRDRREHGSLATAELASYPDL